MLERMRVSRSRAGARHRPALSRVPATDRAAFASKLKSLLGSIKSEGKTIHIYGASTKGNVLLQWCGIDTALVDCAADRNPDKHGARTLGTDIPIVSEEESRAGKPDYYLVLPWHFRDEFLRRERETILAGTRMIFPLPEVSVVGRAELEVAIRS